MSSVRLWFGSTLPYGSTQKESVFRSVYKFHFFKLPRKELIFVASDNVNRDLGVFVVVYLLVSYWF